ncbi:hypothetical protein ACIQUB_08840 [Rhizobium sp. NPDC090275]|uniref:hypothetical protein n=1 Tax=Rhizobium sp. NPDC090275 TaxID=3364498 RepID=UPI0013AF8D5F
MIELIAFIELAKLNERNFDPYRAREEEAFYQGYGQSRLERFAARLLAVLPMKKGHPEGSPSMIKPDGEPIKQRFACGPAAGPKTHRCGTVVSAT